MNYVKRGIISLFLILLSLYSWNNTKESGSLLRQLQTASRYQTSLIRTDNNYNFCEGLNRANLI